MSTFLHSPVLGCLSPSYASPNPRYPTHGRSKATRSVSPPSTVRPLPPHLTALSLDRSLPSAWPSHALFLLTSSLILWFSPSLSCSRAHTLVTCCCERILKTCWGTYTERHPTSNSSAYPQGFAALHQQRQDKCFEQCGCGLPVNVAGEGYPLFMPMSLLYPWPHLRQTMWTGQVFLLKGTINQFFSFVVPDFHWLLTLADHPHVFVLLDIEHQSHTPSIFSASRFAFQYSNLDESTAMSSAKFQFQGPFWTVVKFQRMPVFLFFSEWPSQWSGSRI